MTRPRTAPPWRRRTRTSRGPPPARPRSGGGRRRRSGSGTAGRRRPCGRSGGRRGSGTPAPTSRWSRHRSAHRGRSRRGGRQLGVLQLRDGLRRDRHPEPLRQDLGAMRSVCVGRLLRLQPPCPERPPWRHRADTRRSADSTMPAWSTCSVTFASSPSVGGPCAVAGCRADPRRRGTLDAAYRCKVICGPPALSEGAGCCGRWSSTGSGARTLTWRRRPRSRPTPRPPWNLDAAVSGQRQHSWRSPRVAIRQLLTIVHMYGMM